MDEIKWLIAREIPHLRRYARGLVRDPDAADDLVQDCLERALRKRHLWSRRGTVRNWLFRILFRVFSNGRQRYAPPLKPLEQAPGDPARQEGWLVCRDIGDAVQRLPAEQRAAILLVALEGMSYDEAAGIMGVPVGTVRSRLSRGRDALRRFAVGHAHALDGARKLRRVK